MIAIPLVQVFDDSVSGLEFDDRDLALVELARVYARLIDETPAAAVKVGPLLLVALEALLLTPRARAAVARGINDDTRSRLSPLDELREARARRRR